MSLETQIRKSTAQMLACAANSNLLTQWSADERMS